MIATLAFNERDADDTAPGPGAATAGRRCRGGPATGTVGLLGFLVITCWPRSRSAGPGSRPAGTSMTSLLGRRPDVATRASAPRWRRTAPQPMPFLKGRLDTAGAAGHAGHAKVDPGLRRRHRRLGQRDRRDDGATWSTSSASTRPGWWPTRTAWTPTTAVPGPSRCTASTRALVVTQTYHLARAVALCRHARHRRGRRRRPVRRLRASTWYATRCATTSPAARRPGRAPRSRAGRGVRPEHRRARTRSPGSADGHRRRRPHGHPHAAPHQRAPDPGPGEVPGRPDRLRRHLPRRDRDGVRLPEGGARGPGRVRPGQVPPARARRTCATTGSRCTWTPSTSTRCASWSSRRGGCAYRRRSPPSSRSDVRPVVT